MAPAVGREARRQDNVEIIGAGCQGDLLSSILQLKMEAAISTGWLWTGFVDANVGSYHLWKRLPQGWGLAWLKEASLVGFCSLSFCAGSGGVELIFFMAAWTVLCFGFVAKPVLIHQWFGYCWKVLTQLPGLLVFTLCPQSEQAWGGQETERRHSQDSWPRLTKEISYTVGCHA